VGATSQYAKFDHLAGLMSGKVRFTAFGYRVELMRGNNMHARNAFHVPGVLTVTIYLRVLLPR
jgi:hypothetical protein